MNNKMAIYTYLSTIESKNKTKQNNNEQPEQKQTHWYREHFDGCQMGERFGGQVQRVKGLRNTTEKSWGCKVQQREYCQ